MSQSETRSLIEALALALLLLAGCGKLDNGWADGFGTVESSISPSCAAELPVAIREPLIEPAMEGHPWMAWLHADPDDNITWTVEGLPDGLELDLDWLETHSAVLHGAPTRSGAFELAITAARNDCPESTDRRVIDLEVQPDCGEDCGAPTECGTPETHRAWVEGVDPGGAVWGDDLTVQVVQPDRVFLRKLETKKDFEVRYSLPGGPQLPLQKGNKVNLRYIRGDIGDEYLFIKRGDHVVFLSYNGFLSQDELTERCPETTYKNRCGIPDIGRVPTACLSPADCAGQRSLALRLDDFPTEEPLVSGSAAVEGTVMVRVVDAWEHVPDFACEEPPMPWFLSLYEMHTQSCTIVEVDEVSPPAPVAPTAAVLGTRLIYTRPPGGSCVWTVEPPESELVVPGGVGTLWFELPLVGTWRAQVLCGTCGNPAQRVFEVVSPKAYRVELFWDGAVSEAPLARLRVGDLEGEEQGQRVQAVDLDIYPVAADIAVESATPAPIRVYVRILAGTAIIRPLKPYDLEPGETWFPFDESLTPP